MPSHVALLRGINVGGHKRIAMADLRELMAALGHTDVSTYIQSGNVVFSCDAGDTHAIAGAIAGAIADRLSVDVPVIVLTREELAAVIAANPFAGEPDGKRVHAVIHPEALGSGREDEIVAALQSASAKGGRDDAVVVGRTLYLHTPDGLGRSDLAARLTRPAGPAGAGTARNWATVTRLMAMLDA
jgi:uncharacterized protein (DUF1697 family)